MAKMTGLGKGLDALFGGAQLEPQVEDAKTQQVQVENKENLKKLKITEVEPNRDQPRKTFKQESLEELAESIKTYEKFTREFLKINETEKKAKHMM